MFSRCNDARVSELVDELQHQLGGDIVGLLVFDGDERVGLVAPPEALEVLREVDWAELMNKMTLEHLPE